MSAKRIPKPKPKVVRSATHSLLLLRLPNALFETISRSAKATYRTKTGEAILRLEAAYANESIDEHGCIVVHAASRLK